MLSYARRTAPAIVRALLKRDGALVSQVGRRVGLGDLDTNMHMNQAVYAQVLELGRVDWIIRSGALRRWRAQGVTGVVASQRIVYRRELKLGTRYVVDTRALRMNGRLLEVQGHILVGDRVHTRCELEIIFAKGKVLDAEAAARVCEGLPTDALTIEDWRVV